MKVIVGQKKNLFTFFIKIIHARIIFTGIRFINFSESTIVTQIYKPEITS